MKTKNESIDSMLIPTDVIFNLSSDFWKYGSHFVSDKETKQLGLTKFKISSDKLRKHIMSNANKAKLTPFHYLD